MLDDDARRSSADVPYRAVRRWAVRGGLALAGLRHAPEETAVAFVYNGGTYAVLMATPVDLEDLAVGFSLTEGIVGSLHAIASLDVERHPHGLEVRIWLADAPARALAERRRTLVGPTGCGLCGVESLAEAVRAAPHVVSDLTVSVAEIEEAVAAMRQFEGIGSVTRSTHSAALWTRSRRLGPVREDVGRHNALDKLIGALVREQRAGHDGMVLLTSRVSVEMVQKTARLGAPILIAFSAPTALAVRTAEDVGMTLIGVAREDGFEVFTGVERVRFDAAERRAPPYMRNDPSHASKSGSVRHGTEQAKEHT